MRAHPHFDDRGTLDWHASWAEAWSAARASGKPIFIEYGREACSQCKALVEAVVPRPDIGPLLAERYVALASDCDDADPEVDDLSCSLEEAMSLPFVMVVAPDGTFLEGLSGLVDPGELRGLLERHAP